MKKIFFLSFAAVLFLAFFSLDASAETGLNVSFGEEYSFNNASTSDIVLAGLSQTKFVAAYRDGDGNLNYGRVRVGEVSDKVISYGPEYDFNPTNTSDIAVVRLSENKFALTYQDTGNYKYGGLIIGEVDGSNINFGQEYFFNENTASHISLALLSENKIIVVYDDESAKSHQTKAVIGIITGTEVSFGQKYVFNYSAVNYLKVVALSENKFVVVYEDNGSSEQGVGVVGDISGESISFSQEYVFNPTGTNSISALKSGENTIAIFYDDEGETSNQGRAVLATINNSSMSFSTDFIFNSAITGSVSASFFDGDKALIAYQNKDSSRYGGLIIGQISDESISFDSNRYVFYSSDTEIISVKNLTKENFILVYRKASNNLNYGIGIAGVVTGFAEEPQPEPEPEPQPEPEPEIISLTDGDLIRNPNADGDSKFDVYIVKIVGDKKFRRLILSPSIFESYEHLSWGNIKDVNQATMDHYLTSVLVRAEGEEKIYQLTPDGDNGTKEWLNISAEEFLSQYDSDSVYTINLTDLNSYHF